MIRITQSIPQKIKPGWSVTFLQDAMWIGGGPGFQRIGRPERTMPTLDMSLNPVQRRQRFITPQVHPAKNGIPFILPFDGLIEDIKHPRKHRKHFIEYSVLISDVVYSYSSDKFLINFRISGILHLPQGLKKIGLATPNSDINRSIILLVHHLDDPIGPFSIMTFANISGPPMRIAPFDIFDQFFAIRISRVVKKEIGSDFTISPEYLPDQMRFHHSLLQFSRSSGSRGYEPFHIKLIEIKRQPDQGLLVVRVAADVGQDEEAGKGIYVLSPVRNDPITFQRI